MASGEQKCPNCGQWQPNCKCWLGKIRKGLPVGDFPPFEHDWSSPFNAFPQTWGVTTTTTTTRKPRKRRHYRQVVY